MVRSLSGVPILATRGLLGGVLERLVYHCSRDDIFGGRTNSKRGAGRTPMATSGE